MKNYLLLRPQITCPFVQHIWPRQCPDCVFWFCFHSASWIRRSCDSVAWCDSVTNAAVSAPEIRVLSRLVRNQGHSKSSAYSYSSRSRLQCGLGISKKCLFVRPSSLEMCCPKGLKGLSYLDGHMEKKICKKGRQLLTRDKKNVSTVNVLKNMVKE